MPIKLPPRLKHYVLTRWCCPIHGYFETATEIAQDAPLCPETRCGELGSYVDECFGWTARALPFVTRPRLKSELEAGWQVTNHTGITTRPKSDNASRRRAGKKATGRPRRDRAPELPAHHYTLEDLNDD